MDQSATTTSADDASASVAVLQSPQALLTAITSLFTEHGAAGSDASCIASDLIEKLQTASKAAGKRKQDESLTCTPSTPSGTNRPPTKVAKISNPASGKTSGAGPSYSKVAAPKQTGPDYPHLLTVYGGTDERVPLSAALWHIFQAEMTRRILGTIGSAEHVLVDCAYIRFKENGGYGLLACLTHETQVWMAQQTAQITVEGSNFRAWSKDEMEERFPNKISFFVPAEWKVPADKVLTFLTGLNHLKGDYSVQKVTALSNTDHHTGKPRPGNFFTVGVSDEYLHGIMLNNKKLRLLFWQLEIQTKGVRIVPSAMVGAPPLQQAIETPSLSAWMGMKSKPRTTLRKRLLEAGLAVPEPTKEDWEAFRLVRYPGSGGADVRTAGGSGLPASAGQPGSDSSTERDLGRATLAARDSEPNAAVAAPQVPGSVTGMTTPVISGAEFRKRRDEAAQANNARNKSAGKTSVVRSNVTGGNLHHKRGGGRGGSNPPGKGSGRRGNSSFT